jgi:tetratricopeptide (TPR) repeat protein
VRLSEEELRRRIAAGSRDPEDHRRLAAIATAAGDLAGARQILEEAAGFPLDPTRRAAALCNLAWFLFAMLDERDRVRTLAEEGLALLAGEPETPAALLERGALQSLLAHARGREDREAGLEMVRPALETFERLLAAPPDSAHDDALVEAARLHAVLEDGARVVPLAERYLRADLQDLDRIDGLRVLVEGLRLSGRLAEAEASAAEAVRLAASHPLARLPSWFDLGRIQHQAGRLAEARESLQQALATLEEQRAHFFDEREWRRSIQGMLAEVHFQLGEPARAAAAWREALACHATDDAERTRGTLCLAHALHDAGELAEARVAYEQVLAAPAAYDEDRAESRSWLLRTRGALHAQAGEHEAAARAFEDFLESYRADDEHRRAILFSLGHAYYSMGRFEWARAQYEAILGSSGVTREDEDAVRPWAERAAARVHYGAGRYREATRAFERVLEKMPGDHEDRCGLILWLAACHRWTGTDSLARACYGVILEAPNATDDERQKAREGLAALEGRRW